MGDHHISGSRHGSVDSPGAATEVKVTGTGHLNLNFLGLATVDCDIARTGDLAVNGSVDLANAQITGPMDLGLKAVG